MPPRPEFLRRVRNKFLLVGVVLTLSIVAGATWLLEENRLATYDGAVRANQDVILGLEHDIRHSVDTMDLALRAAITGTGLPGLDALPEDVRHAVLFNGAAAEDVFGDVYITDANGNILYDAAGPISRKVNVVDRDYFQAHRTNPDLDLLMTGPTLSRLDGRWALFLTRRLNHPDGSFAGVAAGAIQLDTLQDIFNGLSTGKAGVVALFTTSGRLLVRKPSGAAAIDRDISQGSAIAHLRQASSGVYETRSRADGIDRIVIFRRVGSYPLGILIGISRAELYASWFARIVLVASALGCLLLLAAGLAVSLRRELRKRAIAERVARTFADEIRILTDYASDLLLRLDWDGLCRFASPACASILGHPDHALVMRNWKHLVHPDDLSLLNGGLLNRATPRTTVLRMRHQDGSWRQIEAHARAVPSGSGVIVVGRDVTHRMDLEAKLRQAHRMEALGQLTAGVAHDFNNILQAQLGCLELLQDVLTESSEPWALASQALELGERGARLTSQLRSFSRQQHLQPQAIPVAAFLAHLIETIAKVVQPQIRLAQSVEAAIPAIFADRAHLESALLNLVLNARDAMPDGGTILIEARTANPEPADADGPAPLSVVLSVSDDGEGMEAATLERACEPFFTTKGVNGTGLGLSSVQGFVAQSGGEFHIASEPGRGTVAQLSLPGVMEGEAGVVSEEQRAACVGRLLFVDDAPDVLVTVGSFLRGAGFDVVPAWGAEVALRTLREEGPFDCLITDFSMPDMNGIELIRQARVICPDLPALVITAWMQELQRAQIGRLWILQKPFRRDALVRELQRIIATRRPATARSPLLEGISVRE
jgi:PAS domain S-box-containing protein